MSRTKDHEQLLRRGTFADAIAVEREYQRSEWGDHHDDTHTGPEWCWLLLDRAGVVARFAHQGFQQSEWTDDDPESFLEPLRAESVKLAAICLAMTDSIDRAIARYEADGEGGES